MLRRFRRVKEAFIEIISNPKSLYYVLNNEDYFRKKVITDFGLQESDLNSVSFDDLGITFPQQIDVYSFLGGTSALTDLLLLKGLANKFNKCHYFEIGTWRGESIANLAHETHRRTTLNFSSDQLKEHGYLKDHIEAQGYYLKDDPNVERLFGDSTKYDFRSLNQKYDLIFIDGDHHWQSIKIDTENVFKHLVHPESIVVWHDFTTNYSTIWWEVYYGILSGINDSARSNLYHVRNTNCIVYSPFEIKSQKSGNPYLPESSYQISIGKIEKLRSIAKPTETDH